LRQHVQGTNVDVTAARTPMGDLSVYSAEVAPVVAQNFNTYSLEYDPLKVSTQPWSMTINGEKRDLNKAANTTYTALTAISGVGFGNYYADGGFTRTAWMKEFKFETIPNPGM